MKILFVSTGHVDDDSRLLKESAALQAAGHDVTILGWREETHGRM
ncbi:glycosyltransferase family 4 protein, partial [Salmonella enterica subsp. enterica serovar Istanbul]|nr:glycosyltransferase family 4 protein [Salmonella enterica subsp. enterica serovar Istanbul]